MLKDLPLKVRLELSGEFEGDKEIIRERSIYELAELIHRRPEVLDYGYNYSSDAFLSDGVGITLKEYLRHNNIGFVTTKHTTNVKHLKPKRALTKLKKQTVLNSYKRLRLVTVRIFTKDIFAEKKPTIYIDGNKLGKRKRRMISSIIDDIRMDYLEYSVEGAYYKKDEVSDITNEDVTRCTGLVIKGRVATPLEDVSFVVPKELPFRGNIIEDIDMVIDEHGEVNFEGSHYNRGADNDLELYRSLHELGKFVSDWIKRNKYTIKGLKE